VAQTRTLLLLLLLLLVVPLLLSSWSCLQALLEMLTWQRGR
jgi:hypothetical protein